MGKDVIFDYSKAAAFIHEEEIAGITIIFRKKKEKHRRFTSLATASAANTSMI